MRKAKIVITLEAISDVMKFYTVGMHAVGLSYREDGLIEIDVTGKDLPVEQDGDHLFLCYERSVHKLAKGEVLPDDTQLTRDGDRYVPYTVLKIRKAG